MRAPLTCKEWGARNTPIPTMPALRACMQALLQYLCTASDDQINAIASCANLSRGARVGVGYG